MDPAARLPPALNWAGLALSYLKRLQEPVITTAVTNHAEEWAFKTLPTKLDTPGAWRAKLVAGQLWVKYILTKGKWKERASVLRMLLTLAPSLPDVDVVYVSSDADPSPTLGYPPCLPGNSSVAEVIKFGFRRSRCDEPWTRQLPVLTNAVENPVRYLQGSLPVPDCTWVGWRHQLPWCQLSRRLEIAGLVPWASREESAYFRGSLTNGRHRRRLDALSQSVDGKQMLSVHHVTSVFPNAAARASAIGSRESPERACAHRYLLSVPGFGYSSRLRSLLACGSAIIHVQPPGAYDEFYMPRLRHHEHLVVVRRVADILPAMRLLQANQSHARRLARNSRRFAMHELTYGHALEYLQALLTGLAARQAYIRPSRRLPGGRALSASTTLLISSVSHSSAADVTAARVAATCLEVRCSALAMPLQYVAVALGLTAPPQNWDVTDGSASGRCRFHIDRRYKTVTRFKNDALRCPPKS